MKIEKIMIEAKEKINTMIKGKENKDWVLFYTARVELLAILHKLSGYNFKVILLREYQELESCLKEYYTEQQSTNKPTLDHLELML